MGCKGGCAIMWVIVSGSSTGLTLQLASCCNILYLFNNGLLERQRIKKWEAAAAAGTAQAWLDVPLDSDERTVPLEGSL